MAETNAPPRPAQCGLRNAIMGLVMKRAGARVPSANRITLLRDADRDGVVAVRTEHLAGLNSPFCMDLAGGTLYIANADAFMRIPCSDGDLRGRARVPERVATLPAGPLNRQCTGDLVVHPDGTRLYVTVGSNSNVAESGLPAAQDRACVLEIDLASGNKRVFASGLRNPNGLSWHPVSKQL